MSDREALAQVLEHLERYAFEYPVEMGLAVAAAKKHLAQLPKRIITTDMKLRFEYPPALVGLVADVLQEYDGCNYGKVAVAVLDVLNTETP